MRQTILFAFTLITGIAFSQDGMDKKFQAGIGFGTGLNLNKTGTKKMDVNGVGNSVTIGAVFNYNFSSAIAFSTGIDIDFETNKIKPSALIENSFYQYTDTKIELQKDSKPNYQLYQWTERKQKPVYLTIPTMILFRTKYFGDFRYFGKFGLRTSFLLGNKINDKGFNYDSNGLPVEQENNSMQAAKDMNFLRSNAGLALGTEWNFSGSTSLTFEVGYYYGFTDIYRSNKGENMTTFFFDKTNGNLPSYYSNDMTQSQLQFKIAVLF
ncbi:MAG: outer membrane beta-barrel protein [Bacteroidota bacterium]